MWLASARTENAQAWRHARYRASVDVEKCNLENQRDRDDEEKNRVWRFGKVGWAMTHAPAAASAADASTALW